MIKSLPLKHVWALLLPMFCCYYGFAQDSSGIPEKYYRLTLGMGVGSGYPVQEKDIGAFTSWDFAFQKGRNVYGIGQRGVWEFQLLAMKLPLHSASSVDLTYGRVLLHGKFFSTLSAGVGLVKSKWRGDFISREPGWLKPSMHESETSYTIGLPLEARIFWLPSRYYGVGLTLYGNINANNSFYGINLNHQFGNLRATRK